MYRKRILAPVLTALIITLTPTIAQAPKGHQLPALARVKVNKPTVPIIPEPLPKVSRGEDKHVIRKLMRVSAYTAADVGMNGKGITASGDIVEEGVTIAAPSDIPLGAKIYIPALGKTFTVQDRGGAIKGNRLDMYMVSRKRALKFGVQYLEVEISY